MTGKSRGGPFVGLIMHYMRAGDHCYNGGDGRGAIRNLEGAARLVKAPFKTLPPTPFNPRYSVSSNNLLLDAYTDRLPSVAAAVRDYIEINHKDEFEVEN